MERKSGSTVAVTQIGTGTTRESTTTRHAVDPSAPLPRAAGDNDELHDELLLIEMKLLRAWKMRAKGTMPAPPKAPKSKIVGALKQKKAKA